MKEKVWLQPSRGRKKPYAWVWCLHCARASHDPVYDDEDKQIYCRYCGAGFGDLWAWEDVQANHLEYPKIPEEGKEYLI